MNRVPCILLSLAFVLCITAPARADEAAIRRNIAERLPNLSRIDEVTKTPVAGLYELRVGSDIFYTDAQGDYVIAGRLLDTRSRINVTEQRIAKLTAIDFKSLPLSDAIAWRQGTGERKLAVFADPNCGYCKKFERDLRTIKNVTVYTFLYPVLGSDSQSRARDIWCSKDAATAWRNWMIDGDIAAHAAAACDAGALARNVMLGKRYKLTGTPALVFEDGMRVPGAIGPDAIEKHLMASIR